MKESKKIGIVYSPGFGAGWSTWGVPEMALDQELAQAITNKAGKDVIEAIAKKNWPEEYYGGLSDCCVEWVDEYTQFIIKEYDGYESIEFNYDDFWQIAK